ncbi:hypothetical protein GF382_03925 [Candidatus Falkowbacteria bacterium]|nr:hypothetical protein [Candidatus Falkowbacteria bacterium]
MKDQKIPRSLKIWFSIHFVIDIILALPLFFFPQEAMAFFGFTVIDKYMARLVAAALAGIGGVSLLSKEKGVESYLSLLNLKIIWSIAAIFGIALTMAQEKRPVSGWIFGLIFMIFFFVWSYYRSKLSSKKD